MYNELMAVTALYDLDRATYGRDLGKYITWLNATLQLPIRFTVFLDPTIAVEKINPKPSDRILRIPLESYRPFAWAADVERISREAASSDLTFKLPGYAMLVMSKFDMLARVAAEEGVSRRMLWIDAGLSRFFKDNLNSGVLSAKYMERLQDAAFAASITPECARALRRGRAGDLVGTSRRLVSGGDMYMTGIGAMDAAERLYGYVEREWLAKGLWDNEQVAMGGLLAKDWPGFRTTRVTSDYASLLADLFGLRRHRSGLFGAMDRLAGRFTGAPGYQG